MGQQPTPESSQCNAGPGYGWRYPSEIFSVWNTFSIDFSDGTKLLQLLEVIGDEQLGKYYRNPKLRIQKCENMNRALAFIKSRGVNLTNIGAEGTCCWNTQYVSYLPVDLVDKNEKLVMGMVWTIILRFTIADIR